MCLIKKDDVKLKYVSLQLNLIAYAGANTFLVYKITPLLLITM